MATIAQQTIKNPRWWASLPVLLPAFAVVLALAAIHKQLWWLGQAICGISNAVSPFNHDAPKPLQKMHKWIQGGVRHNA